MIPLAPQFNWGSEFRPAGSGGTSMPKEHGLHREITDAYVHYNDFYMSEITQQVLVRCDPKNVMVSTTLSDPVTVTGTAKWGGCFNSILDMTGGNTIMAIAHFFGQWQSEQKLRQPWMSRKRWEGSEPLKLNLKLKFLNTGSTTRRGGTETWETASKAGWLEVFYPTNQLMSLVYPAHRDGSFIPPGPSPYHGLKGDEAHNVEGQLVLNNPSATAGHPVEIQVGNFILFQSCYIRECTITYSPILDEMGYPVSATAQLMVESFEAPYYEMDDIASGIDLRFTLFKLNQSRDGLANNIVEALSAFIDVAAETADNLVKFMFKKKE